MEHLHSNLVVLVIQTLSVKFAVLCCGIGMDLDKC